MAASHPLEIDDVEILVSSLMAWPAVKLIALDGDLGVGKSYLARRLSSMLDAQLIEADLFITSAQTHPECLDLPALSQTLRSAMVGDRRVLFDSIQTRRVLGRLDMDADLHVYVSRYCPEEGCLSPWLLDSAWTQQVLAERLPMAEAADDEPPLEILILRYHLKFEPGRSAAIFYRNIVCPKPERA